MLPSKNIVSRILIALMVLGSPGIHVAAQVTPGPMRVAAVPDAVVASNAPVSVIPVKTSRETLPQYLNNNRKRYRTAIQRARAWVDYLEVDPLDLRAHRIKGKKKLTECLDFYVRLYNIAAPPDKEPLMAEMQRRVDITSEPRFHDMASISDIQFKEDATSYLRLAFLMDRNGMDTTQYRKEIKKVLPRLNAHMVTRGADQRMAFHLYYQYFNLAEPFPLASAFKAGVIAARHDPAWFNNRMEVYNLTHEIFVPYQFGEKRDANFFSDEDKVYLRRILNTLTEQYIRLNDPDVVGELSSCMSYLKFTDLPTYRQALSYLLDCQQADGKWGNYEPYRLFYGNYLNQGFYLHTTLVALDALITAFQ